MWWLRAWEGVAGFGHGKVLRGMGHREQKQLPPLCGLRFCCLPSTRGCLLSPPSPGCAQELDRARAAGQTALQRLGTAAAGEAPSRALPPLAVLFATPVEPLEDDLEYMPERWAL